MSVTRLSTASVLLMTMLIMLMQRQTHGLDCWNVVHDVHGTGGVGHKVINLKECLTLCIMDRTCLAVDWHPNNTQHNCWTLKNPVTGPVHGSAGEIIHYELIRRCADAVTRITPRILTTAEKSAPSTTTTATLIDLPTPTSATTKKAADKDNGISRVTSSVTLSSMMFILSLMLSCH